MNAAQRAYLRELRETRASSDATEHSYRPALKALVESLDGEGIMAINEPTKGEYGAPDFKVSRDGVPIGYIECKDIGVNLDVVENSDQLQRYRDALPNLILTDYLEFRWYVDGELRDSVRIATLSGEKIQTITGGSLAVEAMLDSFASTKAQVVGSASDLANILAGKTRLLRNHLRGLLDNQEVDELNELLESFRTVLIAGLDHDGLADLQAQTAAYGLFAARYLHQGSPQEFTRKSAIFVQTTPFLSGALNRIAGPNADTRITWILDDMAQLLAQTDMAAVMRYFGAGGVDSDPIVHFYEDFLSAYDPSIKARRGVYYTPRPVVSYIVRSIDHLLRTELGVEGGLADTSTVLTSDGEEAPRVLILDPATGTGSFLQAVVEHVREDIKAGGVGGAWPQYAVKHLLPRLLGFELLMAPYTIAHLNVSRALGDDSAASLSTGEDRVNIFLTNSLEEAHEQAFGPIFGDEIVREAREADSIKRDRPVMVLLGNPPYSGHSANNGQWIRDLLRGEVKGSPESYFKVDGKPLDEKNPKWLNDDYVKFIRFAQWQIERTGEGVLAFVTNSNYLDAPTFRGMRESLMRTFDRIWVLNLHGSVKKKEKPPGGGLDENVFDIQQGVAISLFVKLGNGSDEPVQVFHADLWGPRETEDGDGKYQFLRSNHVGTMAWELLSARSPRYEFVPRDNAVANEQEAGWALPEIFPINSVGIVTARDKVALQHSAEEMKHVVDVLTSKSEQEARELLRAGDDTKSWKMRWAQEDVRSNAESGRIQPVSYRPFDMRFTFYTGNSQGLIARPRDAVMRHLIVDRRANLGLITSRVQAAAGSWDYCGITRYPLQVRAFANGASGVSSLFPLYLWPHSKSDGQLIPSGPIVNLAEQFLDALALAADLSYDMASNSSEGTFSAEDVVAYIYAVFHSPAYRRAYAELLRSDFPRIPLPSGKEFFRALASAGSRVIELHLMEADAANLPRFDASGTNLVEKVRYVKPNGGDEGCVYINRAQHFGGVSPETWNHTIGGYQPAQKWLKDRRGRALSFSDVQWYRHLCAALVETRVLMQEIDDVVNAHGGWPLRAPTT